MVRATRSRETRRVLVVDVQYVPRRCFVPAENPECRCGGYRYPHGGIVDLQPKGDPGVVEEAGSEFRLMTP